MIARPLLAIVFILSFGSGGLAPADASTATAAGITRVYTWPADQEAAFGACITEQRESREIPGGEAEYVEWWNTNEGTAIENDWSRAYEDCRVAHLTTDRFDFANLTLVRIEEN